MKKVNLELKNFSDKVYMDIIREIGTFKEDFEAYGIHLIEYNRTKEKLFVKIYLKYIGIFIGRKGENINKIKDNLKAKFSREVKIQLFEFDPIPLMTRERFESINDNDDGYDDY